MPAKQIVLCIAGVALAVTSAVMFVKCLRTHSIVPDDTLERNEQCPDESVKLVGTARSPATNDPPREVHECLVLVVDALEGHRIGGAIVDATLEGKSVVRETANRRGLVRFQRLPCPVKQVMASHEGFATDVALNSSVRGAPFRRALVELHPAQRMEIRVVELGTDRPVTGAKLLMHPCSFVRMNRSPYRLEGSVPAGTTDEKGNATILLRKKATSCGGYVLAIHAPGRRTTWWPLEDEPIASNAKRVFRIPTGGSVVGEIRNENGKPVSGVSICAFPGSWGGLDDHDASKAWPMQEPSWYTPLAHLNATKCLSVQLVATSDAHGRYRIEGLARGVAYIVSARKSGYAPADREGIRLGRDIPQANWNPVVTKEGRLVVRVIDPDGKPIPYVYGSASRRSPSWRSLGGQLSDADGTMRFEGLDTGTFNVGLQPRPGPNTPTNEFGQAKYDNQKGWGLKVRRGETTRVTLVLPHGSHGNENHVLRARDTTKQLTISGVVVDQSDAPLPHVVVRSLIGEPLAETNKEGRFVASVAKGAVIGLGPQGTYVSDQSVVSVDGIPIRIVARRAQRVSVQFRLRCSKGSQPHAPSVMTFVRTSSGERRSWIRWRHKVILVPWSSRTTNEAFVERNLLPGTWHIAVRTPGYRLIRHQVDVPADASTFDVDLELNRGIVIDGRIVNDRGEPIFGAHVSVTDSGDNDHHAITSDAISDADGRFEVGGFLNAPFTYKVTVDGYLPLYDATYRDDAPQDVDPSRIVLSRGGTLRVTARDAEGLLQENVGVSLRRPDRNSPKQRTDSTVFDETHGETDLDGTAEFLLMPGRWRVSLPSGWQGVPDRAPARHVAVTEGTLTDVEFVIDRKK